MQSYSDMRSVLSILWCQYRQDD